MAKKQDVFHDLMQETPQEVQALAERIGQLKNKIQDKRARMEQLAADIETRKLQIEELRAESRQDLDNGLDPGRNAKLVRELRDEIEHLQSLMPDSRHVDPAAQEKKELERLQRELSSMLRTFIQGSDTRKREEERFNEVATLMTQTRKGWEEGVEKLHHHFEVSTDSVIYTLHLLDKQIARQIAWHFGRSV